VLANPVMPASGTYDWHSHDGNPLRADELGAVVTKSITLRPRQGNPPPRIYETRGAVLNSIGIPSIGAEAYCREYLPELSGIGTRLITSIAGFTAAEFGNLCARLDQEPRVDAIELNLSCPNIETDSIFATDVEQLRAIVRASRRRTSKPLIAKLSPSVPDIVPMARTAEDEGSDALCIANTYTGIVIDVERRRPLLGYVHGGVTAPALLPVILNHVWHAAQHARIPIIASGGIFTAEDALQYLLAGATAVQVGTANFKDPLAMRRVLRGIAEYLTKSRIHRLTEIVGSANPAYTGRSQRAHGAAPPDGARGGPEETHDAPPARQALRRRGR
jgi:dihydroorotate dehydrogenase (NAD+) catalytic subunit